MTTKNSTSSILSASGARALLGSSILARLPLAMFSIALLVNAQHLTGSFAVAGAVSGAYAIAGAVSALALVLTAPRSFSDASSTAAARRRSWSPAPPSRL